MLLHECFRLLITALQWAAWEIFTDIVFGGLRFTP